MLRAIALALIGACVITCSAFALSLSLSPSDEAAREAALQWLQVVDAGNYKDAALMIPKQVRGSRDWGNYFSAHRAPFGRVKNRQIVEVKHASTIPGDAQLRPHAIIRFKTSFEERAAATEEIVMTKMGCCWQIFGYTISDR